MAINALKAICDDSASELQKRFKEEVLRACYYAFWFWHWGDVNSEKRDLLRDIANLDDSLHDKIKDIIHQISFFHSIHNTLIIEGVQEISKDGDIDTTQFMKVDDLICHLELYRMGIDRFQDDLETHSTRDECWIHGNMRYPERIDSKDQHGARKASTCLMLQLAVFFRLWTHPKGQKLFDKKLKLALPKGGIALPKEGRRHDKIIAAFINATFANEAIARKMSNGDYHLLDKIASETSIRARLEKIDQRILLVPWTDESFDVMTISEADAKRMKAAFTQKTA